MIEVTMDSVEGVQFIKSVRVLEPDDLQFGVPVHRIDCRYNSQLVGAVKTLGLRKVGYDVAYGEDLYTSEGINQIRYKVCSKLVQFYWIIIRWLYDNGRFFKKIPPGTMFSWRYFTPYCWYKSARNAWLR